MSFFAWSQPSDRAHVMVWVSWLLLLGVQFVDAFLSQMPWLFWLVKIVPLLIFLPGMLRNNLRSYIWLCFVCLLYFQTMVLRLFAQPTSVLAITGMIAVVVLFTAAMLFVRWRAREARAE
jgi:uncharacterized membrane protein